MLSRKADRARNVTPRSDVAWLSMADDGAMEDDTTVLKLHCMQGTGVAPNANQCMSKPGTDEIDMGAYYPRGHYMTVNQIKTAVPCQIEKR